MSPALAISCAILPPLLSNWPTLEKILASILTVLLIPIRLVYSRTYSDDTGAAGSSSRVASRCILNTSGPERARMPKYQPPSDLRSAFLGGISFVVSAVGDIVGVLTNPAKVRYF